MNIHSTESGRRDIHKSPNDRQLEEILELLAPVRRSGHGWVAPCPNHDDRHPSLSIARTPDRILLNCFKGCDIREICAALGRTLDDLRAPAPEAGTAAHTAQRKAYARALWRQTRPAAGTVVERYLHRRGINIACPPALRFLPRLLHREYGWEFPALVAGIQDLAGQFLGISVTWLCADGDGKAPVSPPRKIYGLLRGGAVRLAPAGEHLVLCEGLETGLSCAQAIPELPVWAALSASNLKRVEIPQSVRQVTIAADADPTGEDAARALAQRLLKHHEDLRVRIARPAKPGEDFNDLKL